MILWDKPMLTCVERDVQHTKGLPERIGCCVSMNNRRASVIENIQVMTEEKHDGQDTENVRFERRSGWQLASERIWRPAKAAKMGG